MGGAALARVAYVNSRCLQRRRGALQHQRPLYPPAPQLPLALNGKVFIASLLKDQEVAMPQWIYQLLRLIALVGPENVFVSLVESGSGKDDTPAFVQVSRDV